MSAPFEFQAVKICLKVWENTPRGGGGKRGDIWRAFLPPGFCCLCKWGRYCRGSRAQWLFSSFSCLVPSQEDPCLPGLFLNMRCIMFLEWLVGCDITGVPCDRNNSSVWPSLVKKPSRVRLSFCFSRSLALCFRASAKLGMQIIFFWFDN